MWNILDRYVLGVGVIFHIIGTFFLTEAILDGNKYLLQIIQIVQKNTLLANLRLRMQIIQYASLSKSVIIFSYWVGDDRYKFRYYFLYFILNFTVLFSSGLFIRAFISQNIKAVVLLTVVVFVIGFILTIINAFLYQFFKLKSYKYN